MAGYFQNSIVGNGQWEVHSVGRFLRILAAGALLAVDFYKNGSVVASISGVGSGFWRRGPFDRVILRNLSGGANAVDLVTDDDEVGVDSVTVSGQQGAFSSSAKTVTNASASISPANTGRRYLMIQNRGAGNIFVNLAGVAATLGNGVKIEPGGYWESGVYCPSGEIFAIGDIANNPDVLLVEG